MQTRRQGESGEAAPRCSRRCVKQCSMVWFCFDWHEGWGIQTYRAVPSRPVPNVYEPIPERRTTPSNTAFRAVGSNGKLFHKVLFLPRRPSLRRGIGERKKQDKTATGFKPINSRQRQYEWVYSRFDSRTATLPFLYA